MDIVLLNTAKMIMKTRTVILWMIYGVQLPFQLRQFTKKPGNSRYSQS